MSPHRPRRAPFPVALSLLATTTATATAQETPIRFVPQEPMVRTSIDDAPALLAALEGMPLGRLFADPDVARAIRIGGDNYAAKVQRWVHTVDRLLELAPELVDVDTLAQHAVLSLDWRDLRSGEVLARRVDDDAGERVQSMLTIEPVTAAEGRLAQRFEQLLAKLRAVAGRDDHPAALQVVADKVDGCPGLVLAPRDGADEQPWRPPGAWFAHVPGQFAGGDGRHDLAGRFAAAPTPSPGIRIAIGVDAYLDLLGGRNREVLAATQALGLDACGTFRWELRPDGELLRDEIGFDLRARPGGILGALLDGVAPPVGQPLPEGGLLQVHLAFDVPALLAAVDELLVLAELPTLGDMGVAEDLARAWSGGAALAIARPAPGGVVPRLFASFGIVDADAFGRLVARLHQVPDLQPKEVTYEGHPSVQLRIDGAPPALQPSYCLQDGVVHWAESGISLRALLKAQRDGAPPMLDVGDAKRPSGDGALQPGFDLRFDGAGIAAALHELWLPLGSTAMGLSEDMAPLVPMTEMPERDAITPHLRPGRGVLRRSPERVTLTMSGAAGGPELHALLVAFGPLLSGPMTYSWRWQTESVQAEVATVQLQRVHAAIAAFTQREGRAPESFGELLAAGDLTDARMLSLPDDDEAQPVVHDGQEVARTSFAYFPGGKKMTPQGEEVQAHLTTLRAIGWRRLVVTTDGDQHDSWDDFGNLGGVLEIMDVEEVEEPPPPPPADEPKD